MSVRTRLILAFAYVLAAVIVALEVPLALNLQRRAMAEQVAQEQTVAEAAASNAAGQVNDRKLLATIAKQQARAAKGRVIVVDAQGILVADSAGPGLVGTMFEAPARPEIASALSGTAASREEFSQSAGQEVLDVAVPILHKGTPVAVVRVTEGLQPVNAAVRRSMFGLVAIGVAGLLAGLIVAFLLAGSLARPLRRLAQATRRLGRGDLSARTGGVQGPREVEEVARSFDDMADRLEAMVRAQREFAGNASHQLRTPLTGLKLRLESAQAAAVSADVRSQLEAAEREVDRLAEIVERLLLLAKRVERGGPGTVDLADAASRAAVRWKAKAERTGATIEVAGDGALAVGDGPELDQILDNLVDNALSYAHGPVRILSGRRNGRAFLAVEDRGPGIPEDERGRVTERFYRGRDAAAGGSGLGLAIVRELAERWGGEVVVGSNDGAGARVEVRLRPAPEAPRPTDSAPAGATPDLESVGGAS